MSDVTKQGRPQPTHPSASTECELLITIRPRDSAQWEGTAEQLRDEGLIPEGTKWPEGRASRYWDGGKFSYWLRRTRPQGIKGPMSVWLNGDYWMLRTSLTADGNEGCLPSQIYEARCAYENALWRKTPEHSIQCNRGWKAHQDDAFQSFMSKAKG